MTPSSSGEGRPDAIALATLTVCLLVSLMFSALRQFRLIVGSLAGYDSETVYQLLLEGKTNISADVSARVEHVFAQQEAMGRMLVRTIGLVRARFEIGMMNLTYKLRRLAWLKANRMAVMGEGMGLTTGKAAGRAPIGGR